MIKVNFDKELNKILKKKTLLTFSDGCKYTGMTKKDPKDKNKLIPHGLGFAMWPDGQSYKGQFKNGTFEGWGHYKVPNSHEFIGLWKKGFFSNGEMKSEDGRYYVGEFKKSKFHGKGTMNYSGNYKYEGSWKDNDAHGKGKITILKDNDKEEKGTIITGNFRNGEQHGKMKKIYPDGDLMYCIVENGNMIKAKFHDEKEWTIVERK